MDSLEDTGLEEAREDRATVVSPAGESLPSPSGLVQDKDFKLPETGGLWSDEKFWGSGPSPFFFPNIFGPPRPPITAAVVRPYRRPAPPRPPHQSPSRSPAPKFFVGDQHQCSAGSCEFVLFCWLSGGIVRGACGGFLFSCCLRPDGSGRYSEVLVDEVSLFWTMKGL